MVFFSVFFSQRTPIYFHFYHIDGLVLLNHHIYSRKNIPSRRKCSYLLQVLHSFPLTFTWLVFLKKQFNSFSIASNVVFFSIIWTKRILLSYRTVLGNHLWFAWIILQLNLSLQESLAEITRKGFSGNHLGFELDLWAQETVYTIHHQQGRVVFLLPWEISLWLVLFWLSSSVKRPEMGSLASTFISEQQAVLQYLSLGTWLSKG